MYSGLPLYSAVEYIYLLWKARYDYVVNFSTISSQQQAIPSSTSDLNVVTEGKLLGRSYLLTSSMTITCVPDSKALLSYFYQINVN